MAFQDRAQFQRQWILFGGEAHVVQFNVAAQGNRPLVGLAYPEMHFRAAAGVFIVTIIQYGGTKVLADFEMLEDAVGRLQRFVNLIGIYGFMSQLTGRRGDAVGVQFELKLMLGCGVDRVDLDFVKIDRARIRGARQQPPNSK